MIETECLKMFVFHLFIFVKKDNFIKNYRKISFDEVDIFFLDFDTKGIEIKRSTNIVA